MPMGGQLDKRESTRRVTISRRDAVIGGVFALASGVAYARTPQIAAPAIDPDRFERWVPTQVGPWRQVAASGVVLPPPDALRDRLYDSVVTRTYSASDKRPIMLLLAYNNRQDGVLQVHRPEICYSVGGFSITDTRERRMTLGSRSIPASGFTATDPRGREEEVIYFTRLGEAYPTTWVQQRLAVMQANIEGDIPDGMMMRVSQIGANDTIAQHEMNTFAEQFFEQAPAPLRQLLVGADT